MKDQLSNNFLTPTGGGEDQLSFLTQPVIKDCIFLWRKDVLVSYLIMLLEANMVQWLVKVFRTYMEVWFFFFFSFLFWTLT